MGARTSTESLPISRGTEAERLEPRRLFAAGFIDTSFKGGKAPFDIADSYVVEVAKQSSGKVIGLMGGYTNDTPSVYIFRKNVNGTLDTNFGLGLVGGLAQFTNQFPAALYVDSHDRIYYLSTTDEDEVEVRRITGNGDVDDTFNGGDGTVLNFGNDTLSADDFGVTSSGRVVVAYDDLTDDTVHITAVTADGENLDSTFKSQILKPDRSGSFLHANALAMRGNGTFLLAGYRQFRTARTANVWNFNANGTRDTTFRSSSFSFGRSFESFSSVAFDPATGRTVLGGYSANGTIQGDFETSPGTATVSDFIAVRMNSAGTLDRSFSGNGVASISFGSRYVATAFSISVQKDSKVVLTGHVRFLQRNSDFAVARLTASGNADTTFRKVGYASYDYGGNEIAYGTVITSNNRLLLGGELELGITLDGYFHEILL